MKTISLALYCEGSTDRHFLPFIIQRTAQDILTRRATHFVDALPVVVMDVAKQEQGKDILEAAIKARGYHALIVHKDADSRTYEETRMQCFEPGCLLVQQCNEYVCNHLVPVIPVREVEAWMIADREVLRGLLEIKERLQNLPLPKRAVLVETDPDPKATFNAVMAKAEAERRRKISRPEIYEALAQEIRLERLNQVPAYQKFLVALSEVFIDLKIIPRSYQ